MHANIAIECLNVLNFPYLVSDPHPVEYDVQDIFKALQFRQAFQQVIS